MKELFLAIYNRAIDEGKFGLTALYNTEAPAAAVFPYGVFGLVSNVPDWTFAENFEDCLLQFSLYSDKMLATEVLEAAALLEDAFDFHDLAIGVSYTTISLVQETSNLLKVEGVWLYNVSYRLLVERRAPQVVNVSRRTRLKSTMTGELTV